MADDVVASLFHGAPDDPLGVSLEVARQEVATRAEARVTLRIRVPLSQLGLVPEGRGSRFRVKDS